MTWNALICLAIILTKTERDARIRTIAHDLRFQQTVRICRDGFRAGNVKQKISASKEKNVTRIDLMCTYIVRCNVSVNFNVSNCARRSILRFVPFVVLFFFFLFLLLASLIFGQSRGLGSQAMRFATLTFFCQLRFINVCRFFLGRMAQMEQQLPLPMPDLSTLRITTAVSMLGKAYGCGQCSGKSHICLNLTLLNLTTHLV